MSPGTSVDVFMQKLAHFISEAEAEVLARVVIQQLCCTACEASSHEGGFDSCSRSGHCIRMDLWPTVAV